MTGNTHDLVIDLHNKLRLVLRQDTLLRNAETEDLAAAAVVKIKKLEADLAEILAALGIDPKSEKLIAPVFSAHPAPWWDSKGEQ